MIININDEWRLRSDPQQWIVERKRAKERAPACRSSNLAPRWAPVAYWGEIGSALLWLTRKRIWAIEGEFPHTALDPLTQALTEIKENVRAALADARVRREIELDCRGRDEASSPDAADGSLP